MSVIIRKCTVTLPYRFSSFPAFFFSSTSLKVSSNISNPIFLCLNRTGFSAPQIDQMINKCPRILKVSPKIAKAKLKIFHDNGFSTSDTIDIISKHPFILNQCPENRIKTSIVSLKFVLGSTEAACRILKRLYWFLLSDLDKTTIPNFEYLMNRSGLSCSEVAKHMILFPSTFLLHPETLVEGVNRVDEMRLEWSPKMYLRAVSILCSLSPAKLEFKKSIFLGLGFSDRDVLRIFNRCPKVFYCSEKKIKENIEVLLSSGRIDRSSLAFKNTGLLLYSLEKRIKPRLELINALEERGPQWKKLSLSTIMTRSNNLLLKSCVLSNSKALGVSSEIFKAKLKVFQENGFSAMDTVDIISKHPWILNQCSVNRIRTSIVSLKIVLGSTEAVCRVLKRHSCFLKTDLERTMVPNFEYLVNRSGLSCAEVASHMIKYPITFVLHPETIAEGARRVDEMGLEWSPKMYLRAVRVVCSLSPVTLQLKKDIFVGLGFSHREVLTMFNRCPNIFASSERKIKETMEKLLSSGRIDRPSLASKNTGLLLFSLEKRIKPRLGIVKALEEGGLLLRKLGLSTIIKTSDNFFLESYVISNSKALGLSSMTAIPNELGVKSYKLADRLKIAK